jgi:hypothetical protein
MDFSFLASINYLAVAVSSIVFFLLGSLWFSALFGSIWAQELKRHNVTIQQPTPRNVSIKMILTFAANVLASFAMAKLVILTGSNTLASGLTLGIITTLGFAVTTLASVFIWESRSLKLFLIDIGYPALGIIAAAIILSVWR